MIAQSEAPVTDLPYSSIQRLEISGRGQVPSGGGFVGGGFGLEGAATGIVISSLLNAATTQTQMETILQLEGTKAEGFFHYGGAPPARLRIELSAVFGRMKDSREPGGTPAAESGLADQLLKLADLKREGLLSDEEFEAAKRQILDA
jgi:hypothetical protein